MGLEARDVVSGRWVLYRKQTDHSRDCEKYPFEAIPGRVFLDTNVVNALVKHSRHIFEHEPVPAGLHEALAHDVEALMLVFHVGQRAEWDLVASFKTLEEIDETPHTDLRQTLMDYAVGIAERSGEVANFAHDLGRRIIGSEFFDMLPDRNDRELLAHAIGLECDAFCTCDRSTIIKRRDRLPTLPIRVLTPVEWWRHVKPWAGLWS